MPLLMPFDKMIHVYSINNIQLKPKQEVTIKVFGGVSFCFVLLIYMTIAMIIILQYQLLEMILHKYYYFSLAD